MTRRGYILVAGVFLIVFIFRKWKNSERGHVQWDRLKLKFPMKIGDIVQKVALARFSRTFSGLIAAGVPMLESIEITGKTSGNKIIEMAMEDVKDAEYVNYPGGAARLRTNVGIIYDQLKSKP